MIYNSLKESSKHFLPSPILTQLLLHSVEIMITFEICSHSLKPPPGVKSVWRNEDVCISSPSPSSLSPRTQVMNGLHYSRISLKVHHYAICFLYFPLPVLDSFSSRYTPIRCNSLSKSFSHRWLSDPREHFTNWLAGLGYVAIKPSTDDHQNARWKTTLCTFQKATREREREHSLWLWFISWFGSRGEMMVKPEVFFLKII